MYDPASRLIAAVKPGGVTAKYDYDKLNQLVEVSYPDHPGEDVTLAYDALGRRVSMGDVTGESTYTYDGLGRWTSVTQGDGRTVGYVYADNGQLAAMTYPDGSVVSYDYDTAGNLVSVTDAAGVSAYAYDDAGRVVGLVRPGGVATEYGYDARGSVASLVNMDPVGQVISGYEYTYDQAGLIAAEVQTTGDDVSGEMSQVTRTFTYDNADRLVSFTETTPETVEPVTVGGVVPLAAAALAGGPVAMVVYEYDAAGNRALVTRTAPTGETIETVDYTYDSDNRLVEADSSLTGVTAYAYSAAGALIEQSTGGEAWTYEYTAADRLRAVREGGRLLMAASYDGDGNRVFQLSRRPVSLTETFEFPVGLDAATGRDGQADSVFTVRDDELLTSPAGVFWYAFAQQVAQQAAGINTSLSPTVLAGLHDAWATTDVRVPASSGLDQADVDALTDAGVTPEDLDDIITTGSASPGGSVLIPTQTVELDGFAYDLTHYVNNVNTAYTQVVAEYGPQDKLVASLTYGLDRLNINAAGASPVTDWLTGSVDAGTGSVSGSLATGWYLQDGRGSVGQVVSGSGGVTQRVSYDPWGVPSTTTGATASPVFGFNGEEYSPSTGLQYLRARYYEPGVGGFTTTDPTIGDPTLAGSFNRYVYGLDDPVNRIDPSGLWSLLGAIKSAATAVKNTVVTAATWVNNNVVKPVVTAVKSAASWVNNTVIKPVANWVNQNIVQPVRNGVSNAVSQVTQTVQAAYQAVGGAVQAVQQQVLQAYRSTAQYIEQRTAEIKQQVIEFVCGTADWLVETIEDLGGRWYDGVGSILPTGLAGTAADVVMSGPLAPAVSALFGFEYNAGEDFYRTNQHSAQSYAGFNNVYDALGGFAAMDLAVNTVKFTANGKEYMVEMWKGNYMYGDAYGGEIGLYYKNPGSDNSITRAQSAVPGHYAVVDPADQIRMRQELYSNNDPGTPLIRNDTATYTDTGEGFWNLGIRTSPGQTKESLVQKGTLYVDDPEVRRAMAAAMKADPELADVSVQGSQISYTWR
jgi:RHS repeat-associated protein